MRLRLWAVLVALVLTAGVVRAQPSVIISGRNPTTGQGDYAETDGLHSIRFAERYPDFAFAQRALCFDNSAPGMQIGGRDSSGAINTVGWRDMALDITYTLKDSVNVSVVALGIRVQAHQTACVDSVCTFGWTRWRDQQPAFNWPINMAPGQRDTIGAFPAAAGGGFGTWAIGTANTAGPDEFIVLLTQQPTTVSGVPPGGMRFKHIMLPGYRADYTSIRARPLAAWNTSQAAITYNCPVKVRIDILGYR